MLTHTFKNFKFTFLTTLFILVVMSLKAQVDYTTVIDNRSYAFYHSDKVHHLRVDLPNSQEPVLVMVQTLDAQQRSQFDLDAFLQDFLPKSKVSNLKSEISSRMTPGKSYDSHCTLTDFDGIQELITGKEITHVYDAIDGGTGVALLSPSSPEFHLALKSDVNTQVVINVVQVRDVSAADLQWNDDKIAGVYADCMKTATEEYDAEVFECVKFYIPKSVSYMQYAHLNSQEKNNMINEYYNQCVREYNKTQVAKSPARVEAEVDELLKLGQMQWANGEYVAFQKTYNQILSKGRKDDKVYTRLAESYFLQNNFEEFKRNTYLAVATNKFNLPAQAKMIRIMLIEGQFDRAMKIYKKHKHNRMHNNMSFKKYMSADLDFTISNGYNTETIKKFINQM